IYVYKASTVRKYSVAVIVYIQTTNSGYKTKVVINNVYVTNLRYSSVPIVVDRDMLYLNDSSVFIILHISAIIITVVKAKAHIRCVNRDAYVRAILWHIKIKLTIGEYREFDTTFNKNERITITSHTRCNVILCYMGCASVNSYCRQQ